MAHIATRGFLGAIKDVALRGYGIAAVVVPQIYGMQIMGLQISPALDCAAEAGVAISAKEVGVSQAIGSFGVKVS